MSNGRVVIVGAGAAGVFTAYRLKEMYEDLYEVRLFEANDRVGGNTLSKQLSYGGKSYNIDCGAQFFYKTPQASYTNLVEQLGLMDDSPDVIAAPAGFTIWDKAAGARRLWIPSKIGGFIHYKEEDWERLAQFVKYLVYSYFLDREKPDWTLSVDAWLAKLSLDDDFKEKVVKPFMYQFVSLPLPRIGEASALYAVTYFVRNVFGEPGVGTPEEETPKLPGLPTFQTYQSMIGLDGILKKVLAAVDVKAELSTPVLGVARQPDGTHKVTLPTGTIDADHVIFACDPHKAAQILKTGGTAIPQLIATLEGMEYAELPISMQKDGASWMPGDTNYWEPVSTVVDGDDVTFTAWFGPLRSTYDDGKTIPVFKSWGAPSVDGSGSPYQFFGHNHYIVMPTTAFMVLRDTLRSVWQGKDGLWFVGGWTQWFDSQEAALDSATWVADNLPGTPLPATGRARMVGTDPTRTERHLRRWLERVGRAAPDHRRDSIVNAIEDVASEG